MEMVLVMDASSMDWVVDLCNRLGIDIEWRDDGRTGTAKISGKESECRLVARRLTSFGTDFAVVSIDGKELLAGDDQYVSR